MLKENVVTYITFPKMGLYLLTPAPGICPADSTSLDSSLSAPVSGAQSPQLLCCPARRESQRMRQLVEQRGSWEEEEAQECRGRDEDVLACPHSFAGTWGLFPSAITQPPPHTAVTLKLTSWTCGIIPASITQPHIISGSQPVMLMPEASH